MKDVNTQDCHLFYLMVVVSALREALVDVVLMEK